MTLYRYGLRQQSASWVLWAAVLVAGVAAVAAVVPAVASPAVLQGLLDSLPAQMRGVLGGALAAHRPVDAYLYVKLIIYLPLLVAIFSTFQAASLVAREADQRRFDFLCALPVSRRRVLLARLGALITAQAALWGIVLIALRTFLGQQGVTLDLTGYALVAGSGLLVDMVLGAAALWASAGAATYRGAVRLGLGIVVLPFLYDFALRLAGAPAGWRLVLPYGYYNPPHLLLTHAVPWLGGAVLLAAATALGALAVTTFERREL